ncbi:MAG: molybdopterin molybdotransferase MoeA [Oscillospiraceae bacterium]|nr:molybdopterin molybdotransferase MoeA [Oscillospiraceae bacterium]
MLSHAEYTEAAALLLRQPVSLSAEEVPLPQALDRVLAADVFARLAVPPFDKSPFDGYAYRTADVPGTLAIVGTAAAGCRELPALHVGEALRIFTGAPIPPGADAVARQEDVEADGRQVRISRGAAPGTNIVRRGEDVEAGTRLLAAGTRLEPGHLGLLASQGLDRLSVWRRPLAALIPTGTELAEPGDVCAPFGIYNSSSYVLTAYLEKIGFRVRRLPIVADEPAAICQAVLSALESEADLVITTGGASVGDYDYAQRTAQALGTQRLLEKVNMKPGGALLVSRWRQKLLVNLSGNPAAALMSLLVVLRPQLERMVGMAPQGEELTLPVWEDMPKTSSAARVLRGHLHVEEGRAWFREHQGRGNGNIASFAGCELLGIVPGGSGPLQRGDAIHVLRLPFWLL